jgi:hypothetical protein
MTSGIKDDAVELPHKASEERKHAKIHSKYDHYIKSIRVRYMSMKDTPWIPSTTLECQLTSRIQSMLCDG